MAEDLRPNAEYSNEQRIAVVMYGGVSLAIYIGGVAKELLGIVRASARGRDDGSRAALAMGELSGVEKIYRKLAQATDKPGLDALQKELRDRFGPLPAAVEMLLTVGELKILASEKSVTVIEVEEDKLKLTRHGDFITLGGKFPRLAKKDAKARLKEIKRLLVAL